MPSRQAIFGIANERSDDHDKLKELFRNRAELKKQFAALDREKRRLQQLIKEQQGATARITQRLEQLESLLVDPEWAHTVVVFYQLRSLNRSCEGKLAKFAEQLKQQRENRVRETQLQAWRARRDAEQVEIEVRYSGYLERQNQDIERRRNNESMAIPDGFDYSRIRGLSSEVREKLERAFPQTIGQASRIPGMTPAAISLLLVYLKKDRQEVA